VATNGIERGGGPERDRRFSLLFLDLDLVPALDSPRTVFQYWSARVATARASSLTAVAPAARRTSSFIAIAALATTAGLVVTIRAVRV